MATYSLAAPPEGYQGDGPKPFPLIPEDTILEATITGIKEDVKPFKDDAGNPVVKLEWTFQTNFEDQDRKVWGETGTDFIEHPDCKFYTWTQEALGAQLPRGFVVDTDGLIGTSVRVTMGVRSYTKKGETEKRHINYVKDVMRSKSAMAGAAPAATGYDDPF